MRLFNKYITFLFINIILLFISCSNDSVNDNHTKIDNIMHITTINFRSTLTPFDANQTISTRSNPHSWKEGDVIYLQFNTSDGNTIDGTATYTQDGWTMSYKEGLIRDITSKCVAYFFDGEVTLENSEIIISPHTAIYADLEAKYLYPSNGDPIITCNLKPQTSRIRFKGQPESTFYLLGLSHKTSFKEGHLLSSSKEVPVKIMPDGYSPYIYGNFSDAKLQNLMVTEGSTSVGFIADCNNLDNNILVTGKSGFMDYPVINQHKGWKLIEVIDGYQFVDLELPSGTLWATCNIGATFPHNTGNLYAWGETTTKSNYSYSNYTYSGQSEELLLYNDAAHVNWGGNWRMPTKDEWQELIDECIWEHNYFYNWEYKVTSKKNGNYILLPKSRGHDYCMYWSSTNSFAFYVDILRGSDIIINRYPSYYGCSVRPVLSSTK